MDPPAGEAPGLLALSDDVLTTILLLLPGLADLGRASASCTALRSFIAASPSLRRGLQALHPPSLLGLRSFFGRFQPVEPSSPAARAVSRAADFRFSFLPDPAGLWLVRDARDGRFVLDRDACAYGVSSEIAVCDPLFRRYVLLPPIPEELADAVKNQKPHWTGGSNRVYELFLADGEDAASASSPQSFRVIWVAQCQDGLVVCIFSSASNQWRAIPSVGWGDLGAPVSFYTCRAPMRYRNYAYGCFYWFLSGYRFSKLVMLDMRRMEISPVNAPLPFATQDYTGDEFAVVELGEAKRGIFKVHVRAQSSSLRLFSPSSQNHGDDGASEWVLQNEVSLPPQYKMYSILGDVSGKLVLQGKRSDFRSQAAGNYCCVSVDFKTMELQMVREMLHGGYGVCRPALYAGYPPSLSSPTV